jgi:hypothetical protein
MRYLIDAILPAITAVRETGKWRAGGDGFMASGKVEDRGVKKA